MNRSTRSRAALLNSLVAMMLFAAPATSSAQVVFDNGLPNNTWGLKIYEPFTAANDFTLGSTTNLLSFDWYVLFKGSDGPNPLSASFYWQILGQQPGSSTPGAALAAGSVTGATGTLTPYGCCLPAPWEYQTYRFNTSLNSVVLGAGTYWLAISGFQSAHGHTATNDPPHMWANSVHGSGNETKRWTGSDWMTLPYEGAFTVYGTPGSDVNVVPEPATLVLLATGIAGLGGAVRRRRKVG